MIGASMAARAPRTRGLGQMAMDAIRRNGGTLLLPGAATPNGDGTFSYGNPALRNYLDSAGTDLLDSVTQVDQPVGLCLDSMGVLGPELFADAAVMFEGESTRVSPGVYRIYSSAGAYAAITQAAGQTGKTYKIEFTIDSVAVAGGGVSVDASGVTQTTFTSTVGRKSAHVTYVSTATWAIKRQTGPTDVQISNISVREIPGNHATQPTTASKPLLRLTDGRWFWQFDGSNDFLQTGITTGNEGWVCAGVNFQGAAANNETVFYSGAGNPAERGVWLVRNGAYGENRLRMGVGNGTALTMPAVTSFTLRNTPRVVEGGWDASSVFAGVDGTVVSTARTDVANPPAFSANLGASNTGVVPMTGSMSAAIYTPVLPSAADRALIRRFIGSLQGQQL